MAVAGFFLKYHTQRMLQFCQPCAKNVVNSSCLGGNMTTALSLTGTFLDEISHDIPHQNWGAAEWERDFQAMRAIGIDTVILIRSGYKRWLTYPSEVLISKAKCYRPYTDLVDLYLTLEINTSDG
jgi:hypothetical protein